MKRLIPIVLCLSFFSIFGQAQTGRNRSAHRKIKSVTVQGCIREGVECLVLEPFSGNLKYSITRNNRLQVGQAYKITGSLAEISFCQQGFPTLTPRRITKIKRRCP